MKRILTLFLLFCASFTGARATHIVGGNLGYTYLGPGTNGTFLYRITLITYTDCSPTSEIPVPEPSVNIGIYFHDPANPNDPKVLKQALTAPLISSQIIMPPLPPGCSVGLGTCIYKGIYQTDVVLESTTAGYHVYYERCCRNTALINIQNPSGTSTGFYAFIPPTSIPNSSPVFVDDPVPLLCVGDSLHLLNTAVDPDGDQLLYSFTVPYAGFADIFNPAPLPEPVLPWPITPVTYQGGFSAPMPFGPGSYTYINALTGLSIYKTSLIGNFAVAVRVSEYRNGVLISSTRRDMQLISLVCPQNQAPVGNFSSGLNIQVPEGDTLCFDFSYTDPETDSVFLQVHGEPLTLTPPATFTQEYTSPTSVTGHVCWAPPCGSAWPLPYFITYQAIDNGCIPKGNTNIMQITVVPDTADLLLLGDTSVCGMETVTYHTNKPFGSFQWTVTGGTLTQPGTGSTATVAWNLAQGQTGTLSVVRDGLCADDTAQIQVHIALPEFANHLNDLWLCPGMSDTLLSEPGGNNYIWTPGNWLTDSTVYNPVTNTPDSLLYHVIYRDSVGCEKFDSALVAVNSQIPVDAGPAVSVCEGLPVSLGGNPTTPENAGYQWTPGIPSPQDTVSNPTLTTPQTGWYHVLASIDTCHSTDSVHVTVLALPTVDAGPDTSACLGIPFPLQGTGTGQVSWFADGATLDNLHILTPTFQADGGTYSPILTITSPEGCSASDTVQITIWALPQVAITGDSSLCRGDSTLLSATGANGYQWSSPAYLSDPTAAATQVYTDTSAWVYVAGTDGNGCRASDSLRVEVFRAQLTTSSPDTVLCLGESTLLSFDSESSINTIWMPTDYLNPTQGATVTATPTQDITYTAYAHNAVGCEDSAQITLSVKPVPLLDADYTATLYCEYVEVVMQSANGTDSLHWFKNGTDAGTGTQTTVHLNPQQPETVYLVGITAFGCTDTLAINPDFKTLEELLPAEFPNIITPNGDEVNDLWNPPLPAGFADCTRLTLYNRWGAEVYDSRSFPVVWNGKTHAGQALTDGVYFYVLEIGGLFKKGTVTIAR